MAGSAPFVERDEILRVERLFMRFGGLVAIDGLSFSARRGDITAIIGPNGAGKTTVFNCITGFYKPTQGRVALAHGGEAAFAALPEVTRKGRQWSEAPGGALFLLERMAGFEIAQKAKVARTFQNIRLFAGMTALENLLVAQHTVLNAASGYTFGALLGSRRYARAEKEAMERSAHWLSKIGILDRADDPAGDLPYGAQRRLEIARAMCTSPVLLCLDEPAAGLNPRESGELNDLLLQIREEHALSILLIEHDMGVVMGISDRIVVLDYGRKIAEGTPAEIRADPRVIAAYLGVEDDEVEAAEAGTAP